MAAAGAVALGFGVLALGVRSAFKADPPELCRGWIDPDAPARIHEYAKPIEKITNLDGLGDYLTAIAWTESRGNTLAGSDSGNLARGLFGMRPVSARVSDLGLPPSVLKDERTAVALAAWYIHRCIPWAYPGQRIDWLALRRCWGYPKDVPKEDKTSYENNLADGLACSGLDRDFMYETAIKWNYQWPGIDAVLDAVGRPRVA